MVRFFSNSSATHESKEEIATRHPTEELEEQPPPTASSDAFSFPMDLRKRCASIMTDVLEVSDRITKQLKKMEEKEENWKQIQLQMEQNAQKAFSKIKFDVGGKIFATYKATLLRFDGTFFHAMLASDQWEPDEDGEFYLSI